MISLRNNRVLATTGGNKLSRSHPSKERCIFFPTNEIQILLLPYGVNLGTGWIKSAVRGMLLSDFEPFTTSRRDWITILGLC